MIHRALAASMRADRQRLPCTRELDEWGWLTERTATGVVRMTPILFPIKHDTVSKMNTTCRLLFSQKKGGPGGEGDSIFAHNYTPYRA